MMEKIFEEQVCNFGMEWIIPREKFESFKVQSCYQSDTFKTCLPGVSYCLRLYPNGNVNADGKTFIYLELFKGMMKSVHCEFKILIKSTSFTKSFTHNFAESGTWGGVIANKNQLFANPTFFGENKLIFEIEGTMIGKDLKFGKKKKCVPLIQSMSLRKDQDVQIFTGENEEIKVHKNILTSRSSVFKAMFEQTENFLKLPEFSTQVIKNVVDFCYEKDITNLITPKNAIEFLRFSDKFDMDDLKNTVEACLIECLSDENVCQLATISVEFNAKQLRECCVCFLLLKKSDEISKIKNWEKIDKEICQEIIQRALTFVSKSAFNFC